ncbi:hypothetical protein MLD38_006753 [Melastoma candidum]|uniref:Uncharacterized protein n=1 Tax=Melastoma candidum TaxID=119954 RepID=A0ACB9RQS3_9MYRT|nr:hypothetical protein MLD38_006753 [Melastoma candidum]
MLTVQVSSRLWQVARMYYGSTAGRLPAWKHSRVKNSSGTSHLLTLPKSSTMTITFLLLSLLGDPQI